ncbi:Na+-driven multidrug efflux pump [Rhodovulum sulfidophilum]|uniref:Na+-driven multidrug efflux pump n=1 Tax=Rhodovulum sulfidophilum TaxID=35806 RepID=A0A0D6B6R4_RHOSU|nr:Na+-driven multidrug efflux pump [Rhodovulum sulfidophilum]
MFQLNYRLWGAIFFAAFFPSLYSTVRIYFINSIPDTWNVSIAAQSMWLHLSYEVVQEALLAPLYFLFGQVIRDLTSLRERVSLALLVTFFAYAILTIIVLIGADQLTRLMAQQVELQILTARYIRMEAVAIMIGVFNDICIVVLVALGMHRFVLFLVMLRAGFTIVFDAFFVGQFSWSLDLAATGVALTNIVVGAVILIPSFLLLTRLQMITMPRRTGRGEWMHIWFRVALRSGLESGVRNLAFSLMILRLMNEVQEAGLFWVTNGFIWGWLLLPVLTLGTLMRQDAGNNDGMLGGRFVGYFVATGLIILVWLLTVPGWPWFVSAAMGSHEADRVVDLVLLMLFFYVVFAFNHVLDSYFYGVGRTDLMLYQSLFVSIFYYGIALVAYRVGYFVPDLQSITLLFGGGIVIDSIVTLWQFRRHGYFERAGQRFELQDSSSSQEFPT